MAVSKGFISRSHLEAFTKEDFMKKQEHLQHEPSHQPHHAKLNLQNRLSSPVFPSATRKQEPKQTQQRSSFHVIPSRPLSPIKVYQSGLPTSTLPSVDTIQAKTAANPPYPLYPLSTSKIFSFHNSFIPTPSINRDKMSTSMNESTPFQPPIPHQPQVCLFNYCALYFETNLNTLTIVIKKFQSHFLYENYKTYQHHKFEPRKR